MRVPCRNSAALALQEPVGVSASDRRKCPSARRLGWLKTKSILTERHFRGASYNHAPSVTPECGPRSRMSRRALGTTLSCWVRQWEAECWRASPESRS
jgi:hypothetical protein